MTTFNTWRKAETEAAMKNGSSRGKLKNEEEKGECDMKNINVIELIGNTGADAELTELPSGLPKLAFSIATTRFKADGTEAKSPDWHDVIVLGDKATELASMTKGTKVHIKDGRVVNRSFQGADGNRRYVTEILAFDLQSGNQLAADLPKTLNKVKLLGNIGKDIPELRYTRNEIAVTEFSMATTRNFKDREDNWQSETTWHKVIGWANLAEQIVADVTSKGTPVEVEGALTYRKAEINGQKRSFTEVVANSVAVVEQEEQGQNTGADEEQPMRATGTEGKPAARRSPF